ncbi:MAG: hypothetical protein NT066_05300 [Candidatus Omnitrophica bacterium]|nr:hypothetical protein [Candidatus Omnitrophota bacterium]
MSLDAILSHILEAAGSQRDKIIQEAQLAADKIIQEAKLQADNIYKETLQREKVASLAKKQGLIVHSRLEQKKDLLKAKQELIGEVFGELRSHLKADKFSRHGGIPLGAVKKQQVLIDAVREAPQDLDFYLKDLRQDLETEIARILFP